MEVVPRSSSWGQRDRGLWGWRCAGRGEEEREPFPSQVMARQNLWPHPMAQNPSELQHLQGWPRNGEHRTCIWHWGGEGKAACVPPPAHGAAHHVPPWGCPTRPTMGLCSIAVVGQAVVHGPSKARTHHQTPMPESWPSGRDFGCVNVTRGLLHHGGAKALSKGRIDPLHCVPRQHALRE